MTRRGTALLLAFALLGCARGPGRVESLTEPDPREAAESYRRSCAPCHGIGGRGDGPVAPALVRRPPDLTLLAADNGGVYPRQLVYATIVGDHEVTAHGTREMPVWSVRFGPSSGATAAASLWAQRHTELLADHVATLQRAP